MSDEQDKPTLNPGIAEAAKQAAEGAVTDPCDVPASDPSDTPILEDKPEPEGMEPFKLAGPTPIPDPEPKVEGGGLPLIAKPDPGPYQSPVILPSTQAEAVLPGTAFSKKLKLEDKTLAELGITEDDLGDDIELERSPIDGACVVSAVKDKMPVCQYCFLPFAKGIPQYEPAEIQVARPDGAEQGLRIKVHADCHVKRMLEISSGKRKS